MRDKRDREPYTEVGVKWVSKRQTTSRGAGYHKMRTSVFALLPRQQPPSAGTGYP